MQNTENNPESYFTIRGAVVKGDQLGRKLGFPTANIQVPEDPGHLPANGVYTVFVKSDGLIFKGICNIGIRPTVSGKTLTVEVHLFNFSGDLYGKQIEVKFIHKLRDEKKFDTLDELTHQISVDRENALLLFSGGD